MWQDQILNIIVFAHTDFIVMISDGMINIGYERLNYENSEYLYREINFQYS